MRILLLAASFAVLSTASAFAWGTVEHRGYLTGNGTWVAPHMQTAPDTTRLNNWGTQGNVNPNTGRLGTAPAYPTPTWGGVRPYGGYRWRGRGAASDLPAAPLPR